MTSATHGLRGKAYQETYMHLLLLQFGMCAICGRGIGEPWRSYGEGRITRLVIDHNHTTGAIRGLLCSQCNTQVGNVENGNQWGIAWLRRNGDSAVVPDYLTKIRLYLSAHS